MKAIRIVASAQGGQAQLQEVPTPVPGPTQVLVRVRAAGVNRGEIAMVRRMNKGEPAASGEAVLVNAASSGIGLAAIQIAQLMGAGRAIAASRSADKLSRLKEFGIDLGIDTTRHDPVQACARDLSPFLQTGQIRLPIERVFPLAELSAAHALMEQDRHVGKFVMKVA